MFFICGCNLHHWGAWDTDEEGFTASCDRCQARAWWSPWFAEVGTPAKEGATS